MIEFRTLGTIQLRTARGAEIRSVPTQPKQLALLAYLCIARPRGFHRRETLLALFWPDLDRTHARAALRKALHRLRRSLGADVVVNRGTEEVGVASDRIRCDAASFDVAFERGDAAAALELYRGHLLEGFFVSDAVGFERWLEEEMKWLRGRASQAAWYLRNDGVWEVVGVANAKVREGKADQPTKSELLRVDASGGLEPEAYELLRSDPRLLYEIASQLVDAHFPETLRADVLAAVGLDEMEVVRRRKRDPGFRAAVLVAYGYRCAVCDFDARLGNAPLAIEAAHIKWHQAGGPDRVSNGLGLCSLHHKLLDRGAFSVGSAGDLVVSELVNGGEATEQALLRFHGESIRMPRRGNAGPDDAFLEWHRTEVFRGG